MASSIPKLSSHARSISLPSQCHPLITDIEEHLQRLKSSADASSSSSHTLTCKKLDGLKNLYECVEDVLQLPLSQQAVSYGKWEEEILDGSLRLLDICGSVRDIYSLFKEAVHELESSLRRKGFGDLDNRIQTFAMSKKQLTKMISKCYSEFKNLAVKRESSSDLVNLMKQVQEVSTDILESTLSLMAPSKVGRTLFSKLLQHNKSSSQELPMIQKVQAELKLCKDGDVLEVVKTLEEIDSSIQEIAEVLDNVFRLLVKTRVSLLNILSH